MYLDYQAAKPVDPGVIAVMTPYMVEKFGNASSLHEVGDWSTEALDTSRRIISNFVNAHKPEEIIFTSGATEANNLAIIGYALRNKQKGKHVIISEVEHISILNIAKYLRKNGFEISTVPVDYAGSVRLDKLEERIRPDTILISIQHANNEIGTIQPVMSIGNIARENDIAFHVDAVASEGQIPIDVRRDFIDMLTMSSNDIYGPRGVGALYVRKGILLNPLIIGGGQERGLRSGTEDVAAIVGFAKAAELALQYMPEESERLRQLRDKAITTVLETVPRSYLNGHPINRLPNNAHFRFDFIEGESMLLSFKERGIAVSTGSACSSQTLEPSHTLMSLGLLHEEAHGSLEITMGRFTTGSDIDTFLEALPGIVERLRDISPLTKTEVDT
ncbi:MAG TPA: cysteine desulfurase family protein [Candidatus Bathyarchaeia archaeon]|nr:cysteine desulfurase family protein [Candidatus Bathyarchaeia archaeon]